VEAFGYDLGAFAERFDVEPLGVFLRLAGTVLPAFSTGNGESGDGCATRTAARGLLPLLTKFLSYTTTQRGGPAPFL